MNDDEWTAEELERLRALRAGAPPPSLEARTLATLRRRGHLGSTPPPWRRPIPLGWLLAAGILCFALGRIGARSATAPPAPAGQAFLLLLHQPEETADLPPEVNLALAREYGEWARGLGAAFADGAELAPETARIRRRAGGVDTATARVSGEHVGGYFVLRARDLAAATSLAESCPHLEQGWIEVRPIVP